MSNKSDIPSRPAPPAGPGTTLTTPRSPAEGSPSSPSERQSNIYGLDDEDDEEEEEEDEGSGIVDEQSLLWDAQTALISHQQQLAIDIYTKAALPPYKSSQACLSLARLLTRGIRTAPSTPVDPNKGFDFTTVPADRSKSTSSTGAAGSLSGSLLKRVTSLFFRGESQDGSNVGSNVGPISPISPTHTQHGTLATWSTVPKPSKRVERDVHGMGVAAGWLLLGLAWILEQDSIAPRSGKFSDRTKRQRTASAGSPDSTTDADHNGGSDDAIVFSAKARDKGKAKELPPKPVGPLKRPPLVTQLSTNSTVATTRHSSTSNEYGETDTSATSDMSSRGDLKAARESPGVDIVRIQLRVMYDLLTPLIHMYRHGQIQAHDPVFLPSISQKDLPAILRGVGQDSKGRNAWTLGGVIAQRLHDVMRRDIGLDTTVDAAVREADQLQRAIRVLSAYILGMTAPPSQQALHFRDVIQTGHCKMSSADNLIEPAAKRLEALASSARFMTRGASPAAPSSSGPGSRTTHSGRQLGHRHKISTRSEYFSRRSRNTSYVSLTSSFASGIQPSPIKNARSSVTTISAIPTAPPTKSEVRVDVKEMLNRFVMPLNSSQTPPSGNERVNLDLARPHPVDGLPEAGHNSSQPPHSPSPIAQSKKRQSPPTPQLRVIRSSPNLAPHESFLNAPPPMEHRVPSSHFLCADSSNVAAIDSHLAAAELTSALTKKVACSVCSVQGVNFPECRKCGLHFCSRPCRIGMDGAGDGKRHHCGLLESRRGLPGPISSQGFAGRMPASPAVIVQ